MHHTYSDEDQRYLDLFTTCEIDPAEFHHKQHLRIAYVLIIKHGVAGAIDRVRDGILRLLDHIGVDNSKYHETITCAWVMAVNHFMHISRSADCFESFIERNPALLNVAMMNSHYSGNRLKDEEARCRFIPPDLEPIPDHEENLNG